MITQISYNVLIERLRAFADGHFLIKGFTHGHPSNIDIEKGLQFPWMHVYPVEVEPRAGSRLYSFIITFADLPRDKETPAEYEREVISDCIKLAEDLIAEIQNGLTLFGPTVELEGTPAIEVFIQEYSQTLTGVNLALTLSVPWDWSACDIPADWSVGGSGSGGTGSGGLGVILETNGVINDEQTLLDLIDGENVTLEYLGNGRVRFNSTGGGGVWGAITGVLTNQTDLVLALAQKANIADLGAVAFSNDYNDLDNLPSIPAPQVNADWDATTGVSEILNKPTIPAAQIQSDWNQANNAALDFIKNKPTIPAAQVNSDWNAVSGLAQILNKPTIPVNLDDLGDVNAPSPTNAQVLSYNTASGQWIAVTPSSGGSVNSVALSMPAPANPAFSVSGSPITNAGTLAVAANGTIDQYVDGTGALRTLPSTGGGGGQIFYFNGNVSQGTIGGNPYYQLGTAANTGPAANFTRATTGVLARFITNVGSPNHLVLPSGVWTIDVYLNETGGGSNNAEILAKLYTYNGTTFTLIGTSPVEQITNGNVIDLYTFGISVPNTVTAATDRIHIEFDIQNTNGKTVTLYTEASRVGEVHTTYAIGISSLNGLTESTQNFAEGTAGADFDIVSSGNTHTFNLPTASATNRGALSSADWSNFNGKQNAIGLTTVGTNIATLANPNAITFLRVNADNTVTPRTPAQVLTDLGIANVIILGKDMAGASAVNTTTNTVLFSVAIPANTLQANDFIELFTQISTTTPNGTSMSLRVYLNSANNLTGAVQLGVLTNTVGTGGSGFMRNFFVTAIGASGNIRGFNQSVNFSSHYNPSSAQPTNTTINTTITQYILLAVQMANATSTTSLQGSIIKLTR